MIIWEKAATLKKKLEAQPTEPVSLTWQLNDTKPLSLIVEISDKKGQ